MNDSLAHKFCESPHRKLIVVIVTTLFGLLVLIPLVDDYFDKKESRNALAEDLDRARKTADGLPEIEIEVAAVVDRLSEIESRAVSDNTVSGYRNKVVELVREAGCQVRRFDVSTPTRRPWMENDSPLVTTASKDAQQRKTPFTVERRDVVLLVDGPMENLQELLSHLHLDDSFAYLRRLQLHSAQQGSDQVTLEIEMWLFALSRNKA